MRRLLGTGLTLAAAMAALGCTREDPTKLTGSATPAPTVCPPDTTGGTGNPTGGGPGGTTTTTGGGTTGEAPPAPTILDERIEDYGEALRTASFKIVGNAPTLAQIEELRKAPDQKAAYAQIIDNLLADTRFSARMIEFWKTTMRMGGAAGGGKPSRDTAPTFAARLTVEGKDYTTLFTATENTCPTFDGKAFVDGSCTQPGIPTTGILTDAGVQMQYYGNLAFRRLRFFQEVFACHKMPAELSEKPVPVGPQMSAYTAPWPFTSIATSIENGGTGRIDFQDTSGAICANCHATSNHRAPLFANFDANGMYQPTISVLIPVTGSPVAELTDWLPAGEVPAFKYGVPTPTLVEYGAAMAKDDEILACPVKRVWNYAMSKGDIVVDVADVPTEVIGPLVDQFKQNGYNLREIVKAVFLHDDFVRF
jgi:hypothetical protein